MANMHEIKSELDEYKSKGNIIGKQLLFTVDRLAMGNWVVSIRFANESTDWTKAQDLSKMLRVAVKNYFSHLNQIEILQKENEMLRRANLKLQTQLKIADEKIKGCDLFNDKT
jgi:hypothetical protein